MRHRKNTYKLNRDSDHRQALIANMLKNLIDHERIETTVVKAKILRRYADRMVTLAKRNTLASRRAAKAKLRIHFNALTPKEARAAKKGDTNAYNSDRRVLEKLFATLGPRFATRNGGYTRIVRVGNRVGDNTPTCVIEYLGE